MRRNITHSCGHMENISIDGPYHLIDRRVRHIERTPCENCIHAQDAQANQTTGFARLWGTPQQNAQAETIRRTAFRQATQLMERTQGRDREAFRLLCRRILSIEDSLWWIDHRNDALTTLAHDIDL